VRVYASAFVLVVFLYSVYFGLCYHLLMNKRFVIYKYTVENNLTKKRERKQRRKTHTQTNGMYLSKLVIKQDDRLRVFIRDIT